MTSNGRPYIFNPSKKDMFPKKKSNHIIKLKKRKKYEVFKANKNLQFLYEKSIEQRLWKTNQACKWLKTSLVIILAVSNWYWYSDCASEV